MEWLSQAIRERRTIRKFKPEPGGTPGAAEKTAQGGDVGAPSAMNTQPVPQCRISFCWRVKQVLGITPVGWPDQSPPVPPRKHEAIEWRD